MIKPVHSGYTIQKKPEGFVGYIGTDLFFCILEVYEGFTNEEGLEFLDHLSNRIMTAHPQSLAEFDDAVTHVLQGASLPIDFSFAAAYRSGLVLYLKTLGTGQIYLKRGKHFEQIIEGENTASGYSKDGDLFILSTNYYLEVMKGLDTIKKTIVHQHDPDHITRHLKSIEKEDADGLGVVLCLSFSEEQQFSVQNPEEMSVEESTSLDQSSNISVSQSPARLKTDTIFRKITRKKLTAVGVLFIVVLLLINSLNLFNSHKDNPKTEPSDSKTIILKSLKEIREGDIERSLGIISKAKEELEVLKKSSSQGKEADIDELTKTITEYESKVLKREDKKGEEYYDLAIEEKEGRGDRMYLSGEAVAILNKEGKIYTLSLENKSLKKQTFGEIANAELVASYDDSLFFYKQGAGVYEIKENEKPKRVISNDKEWGNITDFAVYNGNIYLLDTDKDEVYKYLVAENGYGGKNSYVTSGKSDLTKAHSIAIDSALYIGFDDYVLKYLSGNSEKFNLTYPESDVRSVKIYTNKDIESIYGWDKSKGVVYVFDKEGVYQKQIRSEVLKKAGDFVVYKEALFILNSTKIIKIPL